MSSIDIDLTKFKGICGKLVPGNNLELLLVTNYQQHVDANMNTLEVVNNKIADALFMGENRTYDDIMVFYKEKTYLSHIVRYKSILDHMILKELSPYVKNVKFNKVVSEDPYIVKFDYII